MNNLTGDLMLKILKNIKIKTCIRYEGYGDGEQNYSIFYKKKYPLNAVNKEWNMYYNLKN